MGQGFQFVGGQLYPLTQSGEVPVERQKANEIGPSVVPAAVDTIVVRGPELAGAQLMMPISPLQQVFPAKPQVAPAPITPKQVISLARKRLTEVKRELSRMKKLEAEKAQLERLLAAADGKPIAVVRDITKRTAG